MQKLEGFLFTCCLNTNQTADKIYGSYQKDSKAQN